MKNSFTYANLIPIEDVGTVYPTMQIIDEWGTIVAGKGMLLGIDNKTARAAGPQVKDNTASGEGWTLTLKPGWVVVPGVRKGEYTLKRTEKP